MKPNLDQILTFPNNEKAMAIAHYSESLEEAIELFEANCSFPLGVNWNNYLDVLYIILHIPKHQQYLPQLELDVDKYEDMEKSVKLKYIITFELYCQIVFLSNENIDGLIELINRHLSLPKKGKFLYNTPLMIDLMVYGRWHHIEKLQTSVNYHLKMIEIPSLYKIAPIAVKPVLLPVNTEQIDHVKSIFPDLSIDHITFYLEYFKNNMEELVNAGVEGNFPEFSIHLKSTETKEILERKNIDYDETLKKSVMSNYATQLQEEQELYDLLNSDSTNSTSIDPKEAALIQYYNRYGESLFLKANRKNTNRGELLILINYSHEQLEGWYAMVSRNPQFLDALVTKYRNQSNVFKSQPQRAPKQPKDVKPKIKSQKKKKTVKFKKI